MIKSWLAKRQARADLESRLKRDAYYQRLRTSAIAFCGANYSTHNETLSIGEIRDLIYAEIKRIEQQGAEG
jgi:hypothetical protein